MLVKYIRAIGPKIISSKKTTIIVTATVVIVVFLITVFAVPTSRPVYSLLFDRDVNLSHNTNLLLSQPHIAKYGNNVYVAWAGYNAKNSDIYFKTIRVGGATTVGSTINLSHNVNGSFSGSPQMVLSVHHIYIASMDNIQANNEIYFRHMKWNLSP